LVLFVHNSTKLCRNPFTSMFLLYSLPFIRVVMCVDNCCSEVCYSINHLCIICEVILVSEISSNKLKLLPKESFPSSIKPSSAKPELQSIYLNRLTTKGIQSKWDQLLHLCLIRIRLSLKLEVQPCLLVMRLRVIVF